MVIIYTTPSCSSCRKAKKWLDDHQVKYEERNLFNQRISYTDIDLMLENAENGFDDIISTRSKIFKEQDLDVDDMTIRELKNFIIENPSILKRPIIIGKDKMQVGYNDEEIRVFIPDRLRELIMNGDCSYSEDCGYQQALDQYMEELKLQKTR